MKARYEHLAYLPDDKFFKVVLVAEILQNCGGYHGTGSDAVTDALGIVQELERPVIDLRAEAGRLKEECERKFDYP